MFFFWFLFFKKKTAYDVRIMDCSSDVCSSDLLGAWFGVDLAVALASDTMRWVVAGYCYLAAAQLALSSPRPLRAHDDDPHGASLSLAGVGIGEVSAVEIGRASCRGRVCEIEWIWEVAVYVQKKKQTQTR